MGLRKPAEARRGPPRGALKGSETSQHLDLGLLAFGIGRGNNVGCFKAAAVGLGAGSPGKPGPVVRGQDPPPGGSERPLASPESAVTAAVFSHRSLFRYNYFLIVIKYAQHKI